MQPVAGGSAKDVNIAWRINGLCVQGTNDAEWEVTGGAGSSHAHTDRTQTDTHVNNSFQKTAASIVNKTLHNYCLMFHVVAD